MREWLVGLRGYRTQQELAWELNISQGYYSYIETGKRTPSVDLAKWIAGRMGFDWTRFYE